MNILYFVRSFPKLSESFVLNEIYQLNKMGHNVAVFAQNDSEEEVHHKELAEIDIPIYYSGTPMKEDIFDVASTKVLNVSVLSNCTYITSPKYHAWFLYLAKHCIEFLESLDYKIDVVHGHFATQDKIAMSYVGSYFDVPCTVTAHATEIFTSSNTSMTNRLFEQCERVFTPSEYNKEFLEEKFESTTPIDVVPATTRVSKFDSTAGDVPNRLLTVARLVEKKGIEDSIDAVSRLVEECPDIEYHIVGTGPLEKSLKKRAKQRGVAGHVEFLGNVTDEQLKLELDEASVFVLSCVVAEDGDRDVMPVVLKEAMAMRTPCVSTSVSAIPELITHGEDGLLVEPHDSEMLADGIQTLLADEEYRKEIGEMGRQTVERRFSLDVITEHLLNSLERAQETYHRC